MGLSVQIAGAAFTKWRTILVPANTGLLGFYDFQKSLTKNYVEGGASLASLGSLAPGQDANGALLSYSHYLDTQIQHSGAFTWVALVKCRTMTGTNRGIIASNGLGSGKPSLTLRMGAGGAASQADLYDLSLDAAGSLSFSNFATTGATYNASKYHVVMASLSGSGAGTSLKGWFYDDSGAAKKIAQTVSPGAPGLTTVIGANRGTQFFGDTTDNSIVCAGVWNRQFSDAEADQVYAFVKARYSSLAVA